MSTMRTCVVCRTQHPAARLLRLGLLGSKLTFEHPGSGRGVHVCVARQCLQRLDVKSVSRGFRGSVEPFDGEKLCGDLHGFSQLRILEAIGLARRQSSLVCGVEKVKGLQAPYFVASDLADRSARALGASGSTFLPGAELGHAAGMGYVGAMAIVHGRLAQRAAYWWQVWNETKSSNIDKGAEKRRQIEVA